MEPLEQVKKDLSELQACLGRHDVDIAVLKNKVDNLVNDIDRVPTDFVTKDAFGPVQKVAYTIVSVIGLTILAFILDKVVTF